MQTCCIILFLVVETKAILSLTKACLLSPAGLVLLRQVAGLTCWAVADSAAWVPCPDSASACFVQSGMSPGLSVALLFSKGLVRR